MSVDAENRLAVVEPGVVNVALSRAVAAHGLHYAPDPSSQAACTIGGNVAENAGGPHCLKYGVTTNHIVALTVLLPSGEIVKLGDADGEQDGYDLVGAFVGSEGCFGIALDITVRLSRNPEAIRTLLADFMTLDAAARAVSAIVATGIIPGRARDDRSGDDSRRGIVDLRRGLSDRRRRRAAHRGRRRDRRARGRRRDDRSALHERTARAPCASRATTSSARASGRDARKRSARWAACRRTSSCRTRSCRARSCPKCSREIHRIGKEHRVNMCNVFHAGDGNLHPNITYNASDADETARVHAAMREIMSVCVDAGRHDHRRARRRARQGARTWT